MKEIKRYQLTPNQIATAIKNLLKKELGVGTYIVIEKLYDQHSGWKIVGGLVEKWKEEEETE